MAVPQPGADLLLRATARARELHGHPRVVKLGGSAMEDPPVTRATLQAVVALQTLGIRQVLVHGGGKPIDRAMNAAGLTPRKVAGRRYTDEATLEIVVRVLNELSASLVVGIQSLGGKAKGFITDNPSEYPLFGEMLTLPDESGQPIDLGRVGTVEDIDVLELETADVRGEIPVLASLAGSLNGSGWLNVNADTAAAAVAGALEAEACIFLTDTPGVLRDTADPTSLIPHLTREESERLIQNGTIAGGMIPKVEACFAALESGARRAVILDGRDPFALLAEFVSSNPSGTEIVP